MISRSYIPFSLKRFFAQYAVIPGCHILVAYHNKKIKSAYQLMADIVHHHMDNVVCMGDHRQMIKESKASIKYLETYVHSLRKKYDLSTTNPSTADTHPSRSSDPYALRAQ